MPDPLNGLNVFNEDAGGSGLFTKGAQRETFRRFQWVLDRKLARSARPYYYGAGAYTVRRSDVYFLATQKITCVISFYGTDMEQDGKNRLATAGIEYHNFPIVDFTAPTPQQVLTVANLIDQHRTTLVYCGAGCGRTGTFVAGWAKLKHRPYINGLSNAGLTYLKANFGVEEACQAQLLNQILPNGTVMPPPLPPRRLSGVAMPTDDMTDGFGLANAMASYKSARSSASTIPPYANFNSGRSVASWTPPAHLMRNDSFG